MREDIQFPFPGIPVSKGGINNSSSIFFFFFFFFLTFPLGCCVLRRYDTAANGAAALNLLHLPFKRNKNKETTTEMRI